MTRFCFTAGTLIHTSDGLVQVEKLGVGDLVLVQPENKGERAYKKVTRTMDFGQKPVVRVYYRPVSAIEAARSEGRPVERNESRSLIVTPDHPFYVAGFEPGSMPPDEIDKAVAGWRRADCLESGALLELADGQMAVVLTVDQIWRTRTEGLGWIELSRDSDSGYLIDLRGGEVLPSLDQFVESDFVHEDGFLDRHDDQEIGDYWAYKSPVYCFEVEDFHTCYVGDLGVWVQS